MVGAPLRKTLLCIDDDEASCRLVKAIFKPEGIDVIMAHDGTAGLDRAARDRPDLVLVDLHMPGIDGLQVLEKLKAAQPALPVIMLTAHQDVKTAVRATQLGAFNYLTKPINDDEVIVVVKRALETRALEVEVQELRRRLGGGDDLAQQMGPSSEVRQIIDQVKVVAASNFTVLIQGETGAGKELVAQAIHRHSERNKGPFVAVDCGAIPELLLESELFGHEKGAFTGAERKREGGFQLAEGGTFFLDEVGNLPMSLQVKLLRVLESRQVQPVGGSKVARMDVRFVAATNHDLQARVSNGAFRADLYFRLAQYTVSLPSLRERPTDILYLTQRFVEEASIELRRPVQKVAPEALRLLEKYAWPGNVRELRNVVRQAVLKTTGLIVGPEVVRPLLGKPATSNAASVLPVSIAGKTLKEVAEQAAASAERLSIQETLRTTGGNKSQAAKLLTTDYKTLHLKMKKLGIRSGDFER